MIQIVCNCIGLSNHNRSRKELQCHEAFVGPDFKRPSSGHPSAQPELF